MGVLVRVLEAGLVDVLMLMRLGVVGVLVIVLDVGVLVIGVRMGVGAVLVLVLMHVRGLVSVLLRHGHPYLVGCGVRTARETLRHSRFSS